MLSLFCLAAGLLTDEVSVQHFDLRTAPHHLHAGVDPGVLVYRVAYKEQVTDLWQLRKPTNFVPNFDFILGNEESMQVNTLLQAFQSFYQVIRHPQLL